MTGVPALYERHLPLAMRLAQDWFLPDASEEDVRQEARVALWEACRAFDRSKGSFPAFARLVVTRRLRDALRRATTDGQLLLTNAERDLDAVEAPVPSGPLAERLEGLSEFEARCVVATAAGLSYAEIDSDVKRVDNALVRARRKLACV